MTETVQTTAPATEAVAEAPAAKPLPPLPSYTLPEAGALTEREFLASVQDADGNPLAVTVGKDGVSPARGRFSTLATRVLDDAKANGATFKATKPAAKPRKATAAPTAVAPSADLRDEHLDRVAAAGEATPTVLGERANPVEAASPVVRTEGRAWGFTLGRKKGRR